MAWNLLNEPRCETWKVPECGETYPAWVREMAAHVKALAPHHLVTIGEEGFYSGAAPGAPGTPDRSAANPQDWGKLVGQDFVADHSASAIDFATVHLWPDNWER